MKNVDRELPAHVESMLSDQDVRLNRLPTESLLKVYHGGQAKVFVSRGLAIQAAASGIPTSSLTVILSFLFPPLLLSAPFVWYFLSWEYALTAVVLALISFRASRALIVERVRAYALDNPKMLDLLISKGTLWFEGVPGSSHVAELTKVSAADRQTTQNSRGELSPAELVFGTASSGQSYFDLPSDHDGWHEVLDSILAKITPIISKSFPNETEGFVEAKSELIGYAAAYEGKLIAGAEIDRTVWNTFVHSVENRIFERIKFTPNLSEYRENSDGSREFISHSSIYVSHMRELEKIIDRQYQNEEYDHVELMSIFSPKQDLTTSQVGAVFSQVFERAVFLCSDQIVPTLEDFV